MSSGLEDRFQTLHEIVRAAKQRLPAGEWDYLTGGTETETTMRRNRLALDTIAFRPRVLRDVSKVDSTSTFLGRPVRIPVMFAPIGSIESFTPGGGATAAQASAEFGVPQMLRAIARLRERGLRVGALTNNWATDDPAPPPHPLREHFHAFVESRVVGMRKPDPRMYELVCRELGVEPAQAAFLDDIGANLKSARALGMHTIKVDEPDEALRELSVLVGFDLSG